MAPTSPHRSTEPPRAPRHLPNERNIRLGSAANSLVARSPAHLLPGWSTAAPFLRVLQLLILTAACQLNLLTAADAAQTPAPPTVESPTPPKPSAPAGTNRAPNNPVGVLPAKGLKPTPVQPTEAPVPGNPTAPLPATPAAPITTPTPNPVPAVDRPLPTSANDITGGDRPTGTMTTIVSADGTGVAPADSANAAANANIQPAPDLLACSADLQARVDSLIAQLDSPRQDEATRALNEVVAIDGPAVESINRVLVSGTATLNMRQHLREVLNRIAVQLPDSLRGALLANARKNYAARVALLKKWLGRADGAGAVPKLSDIPHTLDTQVLDDILQLPGGWPSRFFEKFLMAGGAFLPEVAAAAGQPDSALQVMQAQQGGGIRPVFRAQAQPPGSVGGVPTGAADMLAALMNARPDIRAGLNTEFLLRWKSTMDQLHPDLELRTVSNDLFTQLLFTRHDPAALAWAREVVRGSLDLTSPPPDEINDPTAQAESRMQQLLADRTISMLDVGSEPADLALLRDLAGRARNPYRWNAFGQMRMHWSAADIPALVETIRTAGTEPDAGSAVIQLVAALEDPRLDAALAARADLLKNENLQWILLNCVLARNNPALTQAAIAALTKDGKLDPSAMPLVIRLQITDHYPEVLDQIFDPTNQRLNYDNNPTPAYQMLLSDPTLVKPYLMALNDILGENRTEYKDTPAYSKALFTSLAEKFKNGANPNELYMRARLLADARLMLASTGDAAMLAKIAATIAAFRNQNNNRRMEFEQVQMMWYSRLLPHYPLPTLMAQMGQVVNQRMFDNGGRDPSQLCDPAELRMMLLPNTAMNPAMLGQRGRQRFNQVMVQRMAAEQRNGYAQASVPLNYDYLPRIQLALQYHSPDLALETYLAHPDVFKDNPDMESGLASSVSDVGGYATGAAILERRLPFEPDNATLFNNLGWLYATALDPAFCKPDRAVELSGRSVRLNPAETYSLDTRAYAHLVAGQYANALADFEASYRLTPLNDQTSMAGSLARQARALHYLKRDDEALARLTLAVRLYPQDGDTQCWIARGFALLGRKDDALRTLAQCEAGGYMYYEQIEKNPDFACVRKERLFSEIIDNMKRHRALVRDILIEATPVSELPPDFDTAGAAGNDDTTDQVETLRNGG